MTVSIIGSIKKNPYFIPILIILTLAAAIVLTFFILLTTQTLIFDSLFFIPIILVAYFYPHRSVTSTTWIATLYLVTVMLAPYKSLDILFTSLGHAAIFIIIGFTVTFFTIQSPEDLEIYKRFAKFVDPLKLKVIFIPAFIIIIFAGIIFLNFFALQMSQTIMFDPLFYIPIILVAYFYPVRGVTAATLIATLYLLMVMAAPYKTLEIFFTSLGHAAIFIIVGSVISYLSNYTSRVEAIHRRLAEIVVSSTNAITGETLDGTITDWNKGAEHLYGYTAEEVIGKSNVGLLPSDRSEEITILFEKIRQGEPVERYETKRMTKDGRQIQVSLSISPIRNDRGTIIGASIIAHDITELKQTEEALRQANRQLNLMTSITRHDILNKITVILGYIDIVKNRQTDPELTPFLTIIESATTSIQSQIEFTKVYQDLGTHEPQWLELERVILRSEIHPPITLVTDVQGVEVYADPMLKMVFNNLIDNSIKHGQNVTKIRVYCKDSPEGLVVIYDDDGIGIPTDDKEWIFERGYGSNTGLGLFLAKEILANTGITIKETGETGKGVRFEIIIPRGKFHITDNPEKSR
jgi:PAS domain S-box-containing protein